MARGSDPDSRPISVAELMARAKEQGATDVADAAANSPAATGRRHRGGKDAVSVAELTGEIPRIDESSTPPPTRDFNSAEVSDRADDTSESFGDAASPGTEASQAEAPSDQEESSAQPKAGGANTKDDQARTKPRPTSGGDAEKKAQPVQGGHPESDHSAEETTGVIAPVQAYSQVDDNRDDDHRALSAAEREREFERYRNFEDVDEESGAPVEPKKRKRGVFGLGRKKDATAETAPKQTGPEHPDDTDHDVTQLIPVDTASESPKVAPADRAVSAPVDVPDRESTPAPSGTRPADTGRYLRFDDEASEPSTRDDVAKAETANFEPSSVETSKVDTAKPEPAQSNNRGFGAAGVAGAVGAAGATDTGDQQATVAAPTAESPAQDTDAVRTRLTESAAARTDSGTDDDADADVADKKHERSPALQWLVLIGQVVAGLAVGVALFWGFTELWRWNVYFALVLAVAVIFGLVTLVHVVRRSQDLVSTLLALGVGLLVTIGPLVLLLVAGD